MFKKVAVLLVVLSLFLLTGCGGQEQPQEQLQDHPETQVQETEDVTDVTEGQDGSEGEIDEESKIPEEMATYYELIGKDDLKLPECDVIEDERLNEKCKIQVYTNEAIEALDENLCEKISRDYEKKYCIQTVKDFRDN